ncbi:MFS transporter [Desulfococcaceae bacterium HSG9]|nr:MFS transporter [Desulfococcaceae bacterium HSG9]
MTTKPITGTFNLKKSSFFYGYVVVSAAFFLQAVGWGIFNSFGVFAVRLMSEFQWTRAGVSGAFALAFFIYGLASIVLGILNDRWGPRLIMTGSGIVLGVGFLLTSQIGNLGQLYLFYGIIVGIGIGGVDVVLLSTVARWFVKKRGMMSGIVKVGTGVGMFIMPLIINRLLDSYGQSHTFAILGIIILIVFIALSQFMVRGPASIGLLPDGARRTGNANSDLGSDANSDLGESGMTLREAFHTIQFWMLCVSYSLVLFCLATILMHIVPHTTDMGVASASATRILSTIGALSIAGRFIMGGISDKIGNKRALIICFGFLLVGLSLLQLSDKLWMFYAFAIIHGFAHGGVFALISPIVAELFGSLAHGAILGIVIFSSTIGGSSGPLLAGYLFDITGSYQTIFMILTGLGIIGLSTTATLRPISIGHSETNVE